MFWGRGVTDWTSCHRSDPVTQFALKGTVMLPLTPPPLRKIVTMATRRLNELMNHSCTPQLRHISVSLRAQRVGGGDGGGGGVGPPHRHKAGVWFKAVQGTQVANCYQMQGIQIWPGRLHRQHTSHPLRCDYINKTARTVPSIFCSLIWETVNHFCAFGAAECLSIPSLIRGIQVSRLHMDIWGNGLVFFSFWRWNQCHSLSVLFSGLWLA